MGASTEPIVALEKGRPRSLRWPRILSPSLSDFFLFALIWWLFLAGPYGWTALLGDGDTGWHIRTGDHILAAGRVPREDPFSFSKPGAEWFAWEWLADVLFALAHRLAGLKGVVLLTAVVASALGVLLLRFAAARGANLLIALPLCLLAVGASDIHFLARPHIFTLLLFAVSLWLIDRDRERPTPWVWALAPLTALWTNLHGGFMALLAMLAAVLAGAAAEWALGGVERPAALASLRRYGLLTAVCALATVANPYGTDLHRHIVRYLNSDWIRQAVDEFQSPKFRDEKVLQYEILLLLGLGVAGVMLTRKRVTEALWILLWAHASLTSVRHVPLFTIVAAPLAAAELTRWLGVLTEGKARTSLAAILRRCGEDLAPGVRRTSAWVVLPWLVLALADTPAAWPQDFPAQLFPTRMVKEHGDLLAGSRVFTTDQWGDYLIYHHYPRQRVFVDGRSDFYGPEIGNRYLRILHGHSDWRKLIDSYGFAYALVGAEAPIASLLKQDRQWRIVSDDGRAVLFARRPGREAAGGGGH